MDSDPESTSEKDEQQPTTIAATPSNKPTKGNGKVGKSNYTRDELLLLFSVMERILPIGTEEWEQVQMEHTQQYPGRDIESIRRKYNSLHRKQVQTGNPNIPPEILAAKRVKQKIGEKADIGGGEDETFDLEAGFSGSDGQGQDSSTKIGNGNGVPVSIETRRPSPVEQQQHQRTGSSGLSVASSRVHRKSKDSNQEFLDLWRMQMMMEREERRQERLWELEERREERRQERREARERQEHWAGFVSAIVGGIASAFGVEPPPNTTTTSMKKKRKITHEEYISSDED